MVTVCSDSPFFRCRKKYDLGINDPVFTWFRGFEKVE